MMPAVRIAFTPLLSAWYTRYDVSLWLRSTSGRCVMVSWPQAPLGWQPLLLLLVAPSWLQDWPGAKSRLQAAMTCWALQLSWHCVRGSQGRPAAQAISRALSLCKTCRRQASARARMRQKCKQLREQVHQWITAFQTSQIASR